MKKYLASLFFMLLFLNTALPTVFADEIVADVTEDVAIFEEIPILEPLALEEDAFTEDEVIEEETVEEIVKVVTTTNIDAAFVADLSVRVEDANAAWAEQRPDAFYDKVFTIFELLERAANEDTYAAAKAETDRLNPEGLAYYYGGETFPNVRDVQAETVASVNGVGYSDLSAALKAGIKAAATADTVVELLEDIDLNNAWECLTLNSVKGLLTINGNGHTITGLNMPLFDTIKTTGGIAFKYCNIVGCQIEGDAKSGIGTFIATFSSSSELLFEGCSVETSQIGGRYIGAFIGSATGNSSTTELLFDDCHINNCQMNGSSTTGGFIGDVAGCIKLQFTRCGVAGCRQIKGGDHTGAFIGSALKNMELLFNKCSVTDCSIESPRNAAGFVGDFANSTEPTNKAYFTDCAVGNNTIKSGSDINTYAGGLIGRTHGYVEILDTEVSGNSILGRGDLYCGDLFGFITSSMVIMIAGNNRVTGNTVVIDTLPNANRLAANNSGYITIKDGYYDIADFIRTKAATATLTITGGTFVNTAENADVFDWIEGTDTLGIIIKGGYFDEKVPRYFCPAGYSPTEQASNGYYTVVSDAFEARIGNKDYDTLSNALDIAMNTATDADVVVELIKDINLSDRWSSRELELVKGLITIDDNHKTISGLTVPLFTNVTSSKGLSFQNVRFGNCNIETDKNAAAVIGDVSNSDIISFTGCSIDESSITGKAAGAFIGAAHNAKLLFKDCEVRNACQLTGNSDAGAFVGNAGNCKALFFDTCTAVQCTLTAGVNVGGLVGFIGSAAENEITFKRCVVRGNGITGAGSAAAGGLVGSCEGTAEIVEVEVAGNAICGDNDVICGALFGKIGQPSQIVLDGCAVGDKDGIGRLCPVGTNAGHVTVKSGTYIIAGFVQSDSEGTFTITGGSFDDNDTSTNVFKWFNEDELADRKGVFISGGYFDAEVPIGLCATGYTPVTDEKGHTVEPICIVQVGSTKYVSLSKALDDAIQAAKNGNDITVTQLANIALTDAWTSKPIDGMIGSLTLNGQDFSITGLTAPLFGRVVSSDRIIFNNVCIDGGNESLSDADSCSSAFIAYADNVGELQFNHCSVINLKFNTSAYCGGFVGKAENCGLNNKTILFNDCRVEGNLFNSLEGTGGLIGYVGVRSKIKVVDSGVKNNRFCFNSDFSASGALFGSVDGAKVDIYGENTVISGNTDFGGNHENYRLFGCYGDNAASLTVNGGHYDIENLIPANYATGSEFVITDGTFPGKNLFFASDANTKGIVIRGGFFGEIIPGVLCAEGYTSTTKPDAGGLYTVLGIVARVGDQVFCALSDALDAAIDEAVNGKNVVVTLVNHIRLTGDWKSRELVGASGSVTLENDTGKHYTIAGLTAPLFGTVASSGSVLFDRIHITDSEIYVSDANYAAAFAGLVDNTADVRFVDCSVTDVTMAGSEHAGAFIGSVSNDDTVTPRICFSDCSVERLNATATGFIGGLIGDTANSRQCSMEVAGTTVANSSMTTQSPEHKAGAILGVIGSVTLLVKSANIFNNGMMYGDHAAYDYRLFGSCSSADADITIIDGSFDSESFVPYNSLEGTRLTITGGTFTDKNSFNPFNEHDTQGVSISGGYFAVSVPEYLCAPKYMPTERLSNGYFSVKKFGSGNVTYDLRDSDAALALNDYRNPVIVIEYNLPVKLEKPSRPGYTFVRWTCDGETVTQVGFNPDEDQLIVAEWRPIYYPITYKNILAGDDNSNPKDYTIEGEVLEEPSRAGAEFNGWFSDAAFTKPVTELKPGQTGRVTLYAKWTKKSYNVSYDANFPNGYAPAKPMNSELNLPWGKKHTLRTNTYTFNGYTFVCWNTKPDGNGESYRDNATVLNPCESGETFRLYAMWTPTDSAYTIRFDANNGTGSIADIRAGYGEKVIFPRVGKVFTRTGYTFAGWSTEPDGPVIYKDGASAKNICIDSTDNVTLFAKWNPVVYRVSYNPGGGIISATNPKTFTLETEPTEFAEPKKIGFNFLGWFEGGAEVTKLPKLPANGNTMKLIAAWEPITYTVVFDGNNEDGGSMNDLTLRYNERTTLPANAYTREKSIFNGWNTMPDGSGKKYKNLQKLYKETDIDGETITLYAQWIRTSFDVVLDPNNGEEATIRVPGTNVSSVRLPKTYYTYSGYTFLGWNTREDGSGTTYKDASGIKVLTPDAEYTLYAKWASNNYKIVLYANDNSKRTFEATGYVRGVAKPLPSNLFTREGFIFTGWNTRPDGQGVKYGSTARVKALCNDASGEATLYAQWKPVDYKIRYVLNGGKNPGVGTPKKYRITSDIMLLPIPSKKNSTFAGWYTTKTFAEGTEIAVVSVIPENNAKSLTVYAKWN